MIGITTKITTKPLHENLIRNGGDGYEKLKIKTDDRLKTYHFAVGENKTARIWKLGFNGYTGMITVSGWVYCDAGTCGLFFDVCDAKTDIVRYDGSMDGRFAIVDTTKRYFVATCKRIGQYNLATNQNGFLDHNVLHVNGCTTMHFEKVKIEKGSLTDYTY